MRKVVVLYSTILLVVLLAASVVGCAEKEEMLTLEQIDQIIAEAVSAAGEVDTYQFGMATSATVEVLVEGKISKMTTDSDLTAAIDTVNEKIHMLQATSMSLPGWDEQEASTETYIVGEWQYTKTSETNGQWMKTELTPEMLETWKQIDRQMGLLQTAMEVDFIGSQTVDGIDCYIFKIISDADKMAEYLAQQPEMASAGPEGMEYLNKLLEKMSLSMRQWIAKDSHLSIKAELHMLMEAIPEDVGATEDEFEKMNIDMDMVMTYDYEKPILIELPPEALEAPEAPPATSPGHIRYTKYGFSFEYHKQMALTEMRHPMFGDEASETAGSILGHRADLNEEVLVVRWIEAPEGMKGMLEASLAGLYETRKQDESCTGLTMGDVVESELYRHRMLYQPLTYELEGEQVYEVAGVWYCDISHRFWQLIVMYSGEDVLPLFQGYADSFMCHQ